MIGQIWNQPLSIEESTLSNIDVYPNPTKNRLFLKGITESTNFAMYSVEGREVFSTSISNNGFIDLNLAKGMYLMKLSSNGKSITKKVIIN